MKAKNLRSNIVRSLLISSVLVLGGGSDAMAAASYDALVDQGLSLTRVLGNYDEPTGLGGFLPPNTATGDGQRAGTIITDAALPPGPSSMSLFLHAFGTGTGSSAIGGFAELVVDFAVESTVLLTLTNLSPVFTSASSDVPGSSASAFASFSFLIDGTEFGGCFEGLLFCQQAFDQGPHTFRFEGLARGEAFTPSNVPEPATVALLGLGLAGLGLSRRRRLN